MLVTLSESTLKAVMFSLFLRARQNPNDKKLLTEIKAAANELKLEFLEIDVRIMLDKLDDSIKAVEAELYSFNQFPEVPFKQAAL